MPELAPLVLTVVVSAMVLGGAVKGMVGIGLPAVALALMSQFLEPSLSLPLLCFPILATNLWQAVHAGRVLEPLRRVWPMILFLLVTLWWSARLAAEFDAEVLYGLIGVSMMVFTTTSLFTPHLVISERTGRLLGPVAGTLGGFLGGISTIWGPPMMMYFVLLRLDKEAFIRATGLVWFVASIPLVFGYIQNGFLNATTAWLSALATLPAFGGVWLGLLLRRRVNQEVFRKVLLVAIFLLGHNLLRRALF